MRNSSARFLLQRRAKMLTLLAASVGAGDQALAACDPTSPVSNVTVTCTGVTLNQNGNAGYGSAGDIGNTYNVLTGASVTGTINGLLFESGTVVNSGTISGTDEGIRSATVNVTNTSAGIISATVGDAITASSGGTTVDNAGAISANLGFAIFSTSSVNVINRVTGRISGGAFGIGADSLKLDNAGQIAASDPAGIAIRSATGVDVTNRVTGTISGGSAGISAIGTATVDNAGSIVATDTIGRGIRAGSIILNNSGAIAASGLSGIAIDGDTAVTVNNAATGTISGATGIFTGVANVTNAGTISGADGAAIFATASATVNNSGMISGDTAGISVDDTVTLNNAGGGTISGLNFGVSADFANVVNAGAIRATGLTSTGLSGGVVANVDNSGTITGGAQGTGVFAFNLALINRPTGIITGGAFGIGKNLSGSEVEVAVVDNAGTISGGLSGIQGRTVTVNNMGGGTISGGAAGIDATEVNLNNAGTIQATGGLNNNVQAIRANTANVDNAGIIQAPGIGSTGIFATTIATVINRITGTISGGFSGIEANVVNVDNAGAISGGSSAIQTGDSVTVKNAGTVNGGLIGIASEGIATVNNMRSGTISGGSFGIIAGVTNVMNAGTISGDIGIKAINPATGSTIDNSGAIIGTGGTAIQLTSAADTLTLRPGSRIVGVVDMGFGNDVVNVALSAPNTRLSTLTTIALPTFINFTGVINTTVSAGNNTNPSVAAGTTLATLDPTALALADRALMDFTGGVSSLVQGRLNGVSPTANASMMAMAYAPESDKAGPFTKAANWTRPAPITVWANSFGGQRTQDETASTLRATNTAWSGAIGIDRKVRPDWLVGAFIGGGSGRLSVDLNSQKVDTDYVFAGGYSRFEWAAQFFDFTLQGGSAADKSNRLVLNNGVAETANARYNGWFISPELAYGIRYGIGNGYVLTPTARLRYVAGMFDGYRETGSAQGLTVGSRTLQNFEERGELDVSKTTNFFSGDHTLKTSVHGGVIALQRAGDTTVNTVLIGQNLSFATPGKGSTVGAVFGAGFDYHTSKNVALFGAVEGIAMSDQSRTATARGGVRVAF